MDDLPRSAPDEGARPRRFLISFSLGGRGRHLREDGCDYASLAANGPGGLPKLPLRDRKVELRAEASLKTGKVQKLLIITIIRSLERPQY